MNNLNCIHDSDSGTPYDCNCHDCYIEYIEKLEALLIECVKHVSYDPGAWLWIKRVLNLLKD